MQMAFLFNVRSFRNQLKCASCLESYMFPRSSSCLHKGNSKCSLSNSTSEGNNKERNYTEVKYVIPAILSLVGVAGVKLYFDEKNKTRCAKKIELPGFTRETVGTVMSEKESTESLKKAESTNFSREEVSSHASLDKGVWVIYENKVYDITEFIENHPGGQNKIILAAGRNLEPFWDMYAIHKKPEILEILREYYIGDLRKEDWDLEIKREGPFANDPKRHPALIANSKEPFNAETPRALSTDSLITPNDIFYVRNHLPVPDLSEDDVTLTMSGEGLSNKIEFGVHDLKTKFRKTTITVAIQCAGNRRSEMSNIKKVKGLSWSSNAISNAEWGGVLLSDLLKSVNFDKENKNIKHIHFEGADQDPTGAFYGASIPADRLIEKNCPILIAYEMNGEPIPRDHGFPLRLVAPGIVGARSVKWLKSITFSSDEYGGHWQQNDYKPFSPNIDWHNVDFKKAPAIQELPVTSAICYPSDGSKFSYDEEKVNVKGYAYSGGGRGIIRVDLSNDGGKTWYTANLTQADQDIDNMYSWTLWECEIPIPENCNGEMEIVCKAVDSSCNTQPESVGPVWNLRGVLNNAWHRVKVNIEYEED